MIIISHRGNLEGYDRDRDNNPEAIIECLDLGFDCEIDVWKVGNQWYLGHDNPVNRIGPKFLFNTPRLWLHAKNVDALFAFQNEGNSNYFWHENDKYTLTSRNFVWCYPGSPIKDYQYGCVCVMPEKTNQPLNGFTAVCTDNPKLYAQSCSI